MAILAQEIINDAKILLNDPQGIIYPDNALLPLLKKAHRELQQRLSRSGQQQTKEVSTTISVASGTTRLGDGAGLPNDLIYPIWLKEKAQGAPASDYVDMSQRSWEPTTAPQQELLLWVWREDEIKFVGALSNREVLIRYRKGYPLITSVSIPIGIMDSETFLTSRLAAIAAMVLGENYSRADALNGDAEVAFDILTGVNTSQRQFRPVRRQRTRYRQ